MNFRLILVFLALFVANFALLEYSIDQVASEVNSPFPVVNVPFYLNALATPDPHWDISGALGCEITAGTAKAAVLCKRQGSFVVKLSSGTTGAPGTFVEVPLIVAQPEPIYRWTAAFVGEGAVLASNIDLSAVVMREVELRVWVRNFVTITADEAAPHTWGYHVAGADAVLTPDDPYGLAAVVPDASEAAITRALRRTGLFPDVLFSESHHLIPLSSVSWNPEAAYFSMKIHTGRVGNARFSVTSGLGGDAGSISDAFYTVHVLANRPEPVAGTDEASLRQRRALYPPFMRPTDPATAASIINGAGTPARDFRRDLLLPPHAFLVGPNWSSNMQMQTRDHFLFSLGRADDAVAVFLSKHYIADITAPLSGPDAVLPFAQILMLGPMTLVLTLGPTVFGGPLYVHVPVDEAHLAARRFNMHLRVPGYTYDLPLPGDDTFTYASFVMMHPEVVRIMSSGDGYARAPLAGIPVDGEILQLDAVDANEGIAFTTLTYLNKLDDVKRVRLFTQYSYYHVIAQMCHAAVLFAADPTVNPNDVIPDWTTLGAEGLVPAPVDHPITTVPVDGNIFFVWRPQSAPTFTMLGPYVHHYDAANIDDCQMLRVDMHHQLLNNTMYTSEKKSLVPHAEKNSPVDNLLCNEDLQFTTFGTNYADMMLYADNKLFRVVIGGSAKTEGITFLNSSEVHYELPAGEKFISGSMIEPGVVVFTTSTHRMFISLSNGVTTSEVVWNNESTMILSPSEAWGMLGKGLIIPDTLAGQVVGVDPNIYSSLVYQVSNKLTADCPISSIALNFQPEVLLDEDHTISLGMKITSNVHTNYSAATTKSSEIRNQSSDSMIFSVIQPIKATDSLINNKYSNGYFQITTSDRTSESSANLSAGGKGDDALLHNYGAVDGFSAEVGVVRNTPITTTIFSISAVNISPVCLASSTAISTANGSFIGAPAVVQTDSSWEEFPRGKPGTPGMLSHVKYLPRLAASPFTLSNSVAVTKGCPLGKRVLQPGVSFDPADCPEYSSVDGSKHFITYNPRIHGARDQVDQTLWKVLPDGTRSDTIFEYPFNAIGCPIRLFHDDQHGFRPSLNLIDAGLETPLSNTDFVISETQGRTDFGYSLTADQGCAIEPVTWPRAKELSLKRYAGTINEKPYYDMWNQAIHRACHTPVKYHSPPSKHTPLEVFGRDVYVDRFKNPNSIVFPPGGRDGVFIFRARVVEPGVSQCDLYTDFAIDVYGAVVPVSDAMLYVFGTIVGLLILLAFGFVFFIFWLHHQDAVALKILQKHAHEETAHATFAAMECEQRMHGNSTTDYTSVGGGEPVVFQVFYYSLTGNCRKVAMTLNQRLSAGGHKPAAMPYNITKLKVAENVVMPANMNREAKVFYLVLPVHHGRAPAPLYWGLRRLVEANPWIANKKWGIMTTCGTTKDIVAAEPAVHALLLATVSPRRVYHCGGVQAPDDDPIRRKMKMGNQLSTMVKGEVNNLILIAAAVADGFARKPSDLIMWEVKRQFDLIKAEPEKRDFAEYSLMTHLMSHPVYEADNCMGCGLCAMNCPEGVLKIVDRKVQVVNEDACAHCSSCYNNCPSHAIFVTNTTAGRYRFKEAFFTDERVLIDAGIEPRIKTQPAAAK